MIIPLIALILSTGSVTMDKPPFTYDLHYTVIPGSSNRTILCFHGFGDDYTIAQNIKELTQGKETFISFNFPDYGIQDRVYDAHKASFGTIEELLPSLYVLKKCVIDQGKQEIDLYGFSAGGGALINTIAVLNSTKYDAELRKIGITSADKQKMLQAVQKGIIILDSPLKSLEEILAFRGTTPELEIVATHYQKSGLRPIDSLQHLENLTLNVLLYFEQGDEVIANRDDQLFIQRLQRYNAKGKTHVLSGNYGGHNSFHRSLWEQYHKLSTKK